MSLTSIQHCVRSGGSRFLQTVWLRQCSNGTLEHVCRRQCSSAVGNDAKQSSGTASNHIPLSEKSRAIMKRMIRVDHAGELGADRIYAGQMAILGELWLPISCHVNGIIVKE